MAWYHRLRNVFRRDRVRRDIDRELSFHLAERADDLREGGVSEDEAVRNARRQFGNFTVQVERTRDVDVAGWLEAILRDFRYSIRTLAKAPVFTATVMVTLALGIGANSAVFSAIQAVLLRPLPFPDGDQLMELRQSSPTSQIPLVAPVRLVEWNRMNSTFQAITGYYAQDISEISGTLPEQLKQALVAPRFLQVWGISPAAGRDFSPDEERFGGPHAVLIRDRYWRRRFGAAPDAIGRQLRIGAWSVQIVGVMPASFLFPDRVRPSHAFPPIKKIARTLRAHRPLPLNYFREVRGRFARRPGRGHVATLDRVARLEDRTNEMLYRRELEFARGHGIGVIELGPMLEVALAAKRAAPATELVWTGPPTPTVPTRHTEQVLFELIHCATQRFTITSFGIFHVPRLVAELEQALGRGVALRIVLGERESDDSQEIGRQRAQLGPVVAARAALFEWTPERRPRDEEGHPGLMHAKAAVADSRVAFLTSANLTEAALERNMELGVLIRGGAVPAAIDRLINGLVESGQLRLA